MTSRTTALASLHAAIPVACALLASPAGGQPAEPPAPTLSQAPDGSVRIENVGL